MKIRPAALVALLLWALLSQAAVAATFIQIFSQPGDFIGQGGQRTLGPASAIQAFTYGSQVEVHFDGGIGDLWVFGFAAPSGALVPGDYPNARVGTPGYPFLVAVGQNRGCGGSGRFTVLEVAFASDGSPTKVAIDFELHCDTEVPAIFGGIRFNSALPYNITSTPPLPPQGPTFIKLASQAGDPIGQGRQQTLSDADGKISVVTNLYGGATALMPPSLDWRLEFGPASGQAFVPGTYENAERFGFASSSHPQLGISGEGRGCNTATGRFVVLEWVPHTESSWARLAVDFEQHCEGGSAALLGGIRFNSTVPYVAGTPPATRSTRLIAPTGKPITLYAFTTESSCTIASAQVIDPRAALFMPDGVPPATLAFPHGFLDFRVDNCGSGQPVAFVVEYPDPLPPTATYWKNGPTPDNRTPHWYSMPGRIDGNRFIFTVTDGGLGDDDLVANGSIKDMGGLAFNGGTLQDLWWSGTAENGWGMSIIQHGDILFANVYVYDSAGRPMWLVIPGGAWNAAHTAFTGALYIPHGSPYYAYDVSRFNIGAPVGTATFTFSGENNAVFDYTINGVVGRKNITRLAFGRPETLAAASLGDLWWGGVAQNGWGITVLQQLRTLFSLWFTYDANGDATWYVMPGGEWTSSDTYEGRIYRAVGSAWVGATYDPAQHRTIDVGSYRLRFTGDTASFDYTIDGRSGTVPLTRLAF